MKNSAQGQSTAAIQPRKLTLPDVLEAEFVELKNAGQEIADDKYKQLKKSHLDAMEALENLPRTDAAYRDKQDECGRMEEFRLEKLIEILRTKARSALCFSGGGIRSATFGLGILQGLSHHYLLREFDYLSTVSGGGYIGSWLSAWRRRSPIEEIEKSLNAKPAKKLDGERPEIEHLRSYSNYLTPRLGFFSADTWTLIATVIRNMFLNWMILVPILAVALLIPRLALEVVRAVPKANWARDGGSPAVPPKFLDWSTGWPFVAFDSPMATWSPWLWLLMALLAAGFLLAVLAVFYIAWYLPSVGGNNCSQKRYLFSVLTPLCLSSILLSTFWICWNRPGGTLPLYSYVAFGASLHLCGWLLYKLVRVLIPDPRVRSAHRRPMEGSTMLARAAASLERTVVDAPVLLVAMLTGGFGGWVAWVLTYNLRAYDADLATCFGFPVVLGIYFFATVLLIGLTSNTTNDDDREWWARAGGWILIVSVGWLLGSVLVVYGPHWVESVGKWVFSAGGVAGIGGSLAGRSAITASDTSDSESDSRPNSKGDSRNRSKTGSDKSGKKADSSGLFSAKTWLGVVAAVAPLVFLIALLLGISESADRLVWYMAKGWLRRLPLPHWLDPHPLAVGVIMAIALLIAWAMAKFVNVNTFSLHAMYRNRLIRAYLGAARTQDRKPEATLNLFTGFDPQDNFRVHELPAGKPFHILNMCLNLVHGERLAWQERKAETFTVSRLHSGSVRVGYQKSEDYGDRPDKDGNPTGITLGTAMAISGAAASPNMGYHSSPLLTFLMTFFNARLGWWLANPGDPGKKFWRDRGPKSAMDSLIAEALGNTDDQNPYVYLSDGGHFENLGLYEMVLRRCDTIVVIDAGADPDYQFEDLANAIRKIRVDLGVTIHFDKPLQMQPGEAAGNVHCATATICYDCIDGGGEKDRGTLIYIKPVLEPMLSVDLDQYHSAHPDFPQQPTADQWFDESQFESYRRLGLETIDSICENNFSRIPMTLKDFVTEARAHKNSYEAGAHAVLTSLSVVAAGDCVRSIEETEIAEVLNGRNACASDAMGIRNSIAGGDH